MRLVLLFIFIVLGAGYLAFLRFQHRVAQDDVHERVAGYDRCVDALGADPAGIKARQDCNQFWLQTPHTLANGWRNWAGID